MATRKRKAPDCVPSRTVTFTLNGIDLRLTASEGVLQRLTALLLFARHEELMNNPEFQASLEEPLVWGEPEPTKPLPAGLMDEKELRADVTARLKKLIEVSGPHLARKYLGAFDAAGGGGPAQKVSDLDMDGLEGLWNLLVKAKTD